MYEAVPTITPVAVFWGCYPGDLFFGKFWLDISVAGRLGQAEVQHFRWRAFTKMLSGLMSRWTMPAACAASSASATRLIARAAVPPTGPR